MSGLNEQLRLEDHSGVEWVRPPLRDAFEALLTSTDRFSQSGYELHVSPALIEGMGEPLPSQRFMTRRIAPLLLSQAAPTKRYPAEDLLDRMTEDHLFYPIVVTLSVFLGSLSPLAVSERLRLSVEGFVSRVASHAPVTGKGARGEVVTSPTAPEDLASMRCRELTRWYEGLPEERRAVLDPVIQRVQEQLTRHAQNIEGLEEEVARALVRGAVERFGMDFAESQVAPRVVELWLKESGYVEVRFAASEALTLPAVLEVSAAADTDRTSTGAVSLGEELGRETPPVPLPPPLPAEEPDTVHRTLGETIAFYLESEHFKILQEWHGLEIPESSVRYAMNFIDAFRREQQQPLSRLEALHHMLNLAATHAKKTGADAVSNPDIIMGIVPYMSGQARQVPKTPRPPKYDPLKTTQPGVPHSKMAPDPTPDEIPVVPAEEVQDSKSHEAFLRRVVEGYDELSLLDQVTVLQQFQAILSANQDDPELTRHRGADGDLREEGMREVAKRTLATVDPELRAILSLRDVASPSAQREMSIEQFLERHIVDFREYGLMDQAEMLMAFEEALRGEGVRAGEFLDVRRAHKLLERMRQRAGERDAFYDLKLVDRDRAENRFEDVMRIRVQSR